MEPPDNLERAKKSEMGSSYQPKDYDNLTNHQRYWLLVDLVRDEMHSAQEGYAAENAGRKFAAYTMDMQRNIISWMNRKAKTHLPQFENNPHRVREPFDDVGGSSGSGQTSDIRA